MRRIPFPVALSLAIALSACQSQTPLPPGDAASLQVLEDCPVTKPPEPAFVPPSPWPAVPPNEDQFWFGAGGLWTALPRSGTWRQLASGDKFWWWSENYGSADAAEDPIPDLDVTARRLDGPAPEYRASDATNGFHPSFNQAMLIGVELPAGGCWEFSARFKQDQLSLILRVPP